MDTRHNIAQFGEGNDYWYFDGWQGFAGDWIDDWYQAELSGPGERSVTGPHRATVEKALKDFERLQNDPERMPYETARIIKCSPALKISIEKEIEI